MPIKTTVVKVTYGKSKSGREFAIIEGITHMFGIFRCIVPPDIGRTAENMIDYPDNTIMTVEPYVNREYMLCCRVKGFELDM